MTEAVNEWLLIQKMLIHWDAISWSILTVLAVWKVAKTVYISWNCIGIGNNINVIVLNLTYVINNFYHLIREEAGVKEEEVCCV